MLKIVISGPIGCGKSTVVRRVMKRMGWQNPAGFFTGREFDLLTISTWQGEQQTVARRTDKPPPGSPPYAADLDAFDRFALQAFGNNTGDQPVVMDELGILELPAQRFIQTVAGTFQAPHGVLAVIQQRALDAWLAQIGREHVNQLFMVTPDNRESLPDQILALLK